MKELINEIKEKLNELETLANKKQLFNVKCVIPTELDYVNLRDGTIIDKLQRIVQQLELQWINMLPTPEDSNLVRSALVAETGEEGLKYWLKIRKFKENFNEKEQIQKYNNLLKYSDKNTMTFGAIVNRYKKAVDNHNNKLKR